MRSASSPRLDVVQRHLPRGEGAGLVEHHGVDPPGRLQHLRALDQHAELRAAAGADEQRRGRGQAQRARAGDDQHGDRGRERGVRPGARTEPEGQRRDRERDHDRHEHARHPVGEPLDRGLAALRVLDEAGHPGELGVGADAGGAHHQSAAHVGAPADHRGTPPHLDRHRLAGEHRGVERGGAVVDHAVGGDRLAGADHEPVADLQRRRGHPHLAAVAQHRRLLGAEVEQRGERGSRPPLGARFEPAAEQHERRDGRADLEVGHPLAAQQRDDRPAQRGQGAERDERVHRGRAVAQVRRGRAVQRPGTPDDGGRGERERDPLPVGERRAGTMDSTTTGTASAVTTRKRSRRGRVGSASGSGSGCGQRGRVARRLHLRDERGRVERGG